MQDPQSSASIVEVDFRANPVNMKNVLSEQRKLKDAILARILTCSICDPSSFSLGLDGVICLPHPSPKPVNKHQQRSFLECAAINDVI